MGFKVLLIMQYLILEILMETVLDVHARGVKKNKKKFDLDVVMMHLLQKNVHGRIHVLVYTWRTICFSRDHARKDFKKYQFKK